MVPEEGKENYLNGGYFFDIELNELKRLMELERSKNLIEVTI